ncbi:hypothetical protein WJX79_000706 [Trebouxia sp. C0005]
MSSPEPEVANGKRDVSPRGKDDRSPSPRKRSPASDRSRSMSRSASRSRSASSRSRSKSSRSRSRSRSRSPRRRRSYSRSRSRSRGRNDRDRYRGRDSGRDYGRSGGDRYGGGDRGGYGGGDSRSRQAWRQGDWECDRCRAHNFASRGRCYACGSDKAPERGYSSRDRGYGGGGGLRQIGFGKAWSGVTDLQQVAVAVATR